MAIFDPVSATLTSADGAEQSRRQDLAEPVLLARRSARAGTQLLGRGGRAAATAGPDQSPLLAGALRRLARCDRRDHRARRDSVADHRHPPAISSREARCGCVGAAHRHRTERRAARETWFVVGRLRPDVTFEQAQAEMSAIARRLDDQLPAADRNRGISVVPLSLQWSDAKRGWRCGCSSGAVFCVFLIAAANVASLSLARSAGRAREMAVRAALGASPGRIVRQLLAESVMLAAISGLLGIAARRRRHPPHPGLRPWQPGASE